MRRVFILGAGATASYENSMLQRFALNLRPPTIGKFLKCALDLTDLPDSAWNQDALLRDNHFRIDDYPNVLDFLERYYGFDKAALGRLDVDIEELLTFLDLNGDYSVVRDELIRLMACVLHAALVGYDCHHHKSLVEKLSPKDAIITFNWDLLIDHVLAPTNEQLPQADRPPNGRYMPNYGYQGMHGISLDASRVCIRRHVPVLLKLHGSLNWLKCQKCRIPYAFVDGKAAVWVYKGMRERCRATGCDGTCEPIIVLPTLVKDYSDDMVKRLWSKADEIIRSCDEVVVVGYSLPPTDFKAKWLFMKATADDKRRQVKIFDRCPERLRERFARAFHVQRDAVECNQGGIKEAAAQVVECDSGDEC